MRQGSTTSHSPWLALVRHICHVSSQPQGVENDQDHAEHSRYHESVGQRRDQASVSLFLLAQFTLTFQWAFSANLTSCQNITENHINETFDLLGPVPHLCIDFSSDELKQYKRELRTDLWRITVDKIEKIITDIFAHSMDAVLDKIYFSAASSGMLFMVLPIVSPITSSIQSRLATHFRNLHRDEQIRLYKYFQSVPDSRNLKVAGILKREP